MADFTRCCRTCRWGKPDFPLGWKYAKCHHPTSAQFNRVTGRMEYRPRYCSVRVDYLDECGPDLRDWQRRQSLPERFYRWIKSKVTRTTAMEPVNRAAAE